MKSMLTQSLLTAYKHYTHVSYNSVCSVLLLFSFSNGKAQKEDGKPRASLSLLANAENEEMQLPM